MTPATPDLGYAVTLAPADAIAYLESKGYAIGFSWRDVWQEAHAKAFTAAGVMKVDVLADLKDGLVKSLQTGGTRQDFIQQVTPLLQAKGWWGRDAQVDPTTGEVLGKGLTPRRLATIFDTNMQSAYMAGSYKAMMANVADRPYFMYVAIMDRHTRPAHAAMNGRTFRYDDPIWRTSWPVNGFRCRCSVRALDAEDLKTHGIDLSSSQGKLSDIEIATSRKPGAPTATVTRFEYAPGKYFHPDPGFNYNPGLAALKPFTPPPLDTLPKTFSPGVALPNLPAPTVVPAARLLADGLPPADYARAFLAEFGAAVGAGVLFEDVTGAPLAIDEALFQDGAGNWKADKRGRGPYLALLADTVKAPAEIWLRWEESRLKPGTWLLKRRYLQTFAMQEGGEAVYGIGAFEWSKEGWTGSTIFRADAATDAKRLAYLNAQRDGFLLYQQ